MDDELTGLYTLEKNGEESDGGAAEPTALGGEDGGDALNAKGGETTGSTTRRGPATIKSAAGRGKATAPRKVAKGGKAGNPGNFQGESLLYLQGLLPDYTALQAQADGRGKLDRLDAFWTGLREGFWKRFTWKEFTVTFKETKETAVIDKVNNVGHREARPDGNTHMTLQGTQGLVPLPMQDDHGVCQEPVVSSRERTLQATTQKGPKTAVRMAVVGEAAQRGGGGAREPTCRYRRVERGSA